MSASASHGSTTRVTVLDVLRLLSELAAFASLALWGFLTWPLGWNILFGLATPAAAILFWALFVSPRAVFAVHPFARALVELLIFAAATIALWNLGLGWVGLAFGVVAVVIGLIHGRRAIS